MRLESYQKGKSEKGTRIVVSGLDHDYGQLAFRAEDRGTRLGKKLLRTPNVQLGDAEFDRSVYLQGSPELACALFDAQTRGVVVRLVSGMVEPEPVHVQGSVMLEADALRVEVRELTRYNTTQILPSVLLNLMAIARRLVRPPDLAGRLMQNLGGDPLPAVRLTNLRMLLERHGGDPRTPQALVSALGDESEDVRFQAALALGEPGRATLLEIAASPGSDDARAARAIAGLGEHFTADRARDVLEQALSFARLETALACLDALGARGGRAAVEPLAKVLAAEPPKLAAAAAAARWPRRAWPPQKCH